MKKAASKSFTPIQLKFQKTLNLHRTGQLVQAQTLCQDILKAQPRHFDALHLMGVDPLQGLISTGRFGGLYMKPAVISCIR